MASLWCGVEERASSFQRLTWNTSHNWVTHWGHEWRNNSFMCLLPWCFFRAPFSLKAFSHWEHKCLFSFLNLLSMRFKCHSRLECWEKVLPHSEHRYALSFVWTLLWLMRSASHLNLQHTGIANDPCATTRVGLFWMVCSFYGYSHSVWGKVKRQWRYWNGVCETLCRALCLVTPSCTHCSTGCCKSVCVCPVRLCTWTPPDSRHICKDSSLRIHALLCVLEVRSAQVHLKGRKEFKSAVASGRRSPQWGSGFSCDSSGLCLQALCRWSNFFFSRCWLCGSALCL